MDRRKGTSRSGAAMPETRLTIEKVCALTGWGERHVRTLTRTQGWQTRLSESRGRNGKQEREYLLSSLPADAQAKFATEHKNSAITLFAAPTTLSLFAPLPEVPEPVRLQLDEEKRKEANRWLDAIAQFNDLAERAKHGNPLRLPNGKALEIKLDIAEYVAA